MAILTWDPVERPYYAGVDKGVLYLSGFPGLAWNGLVSVTEMPGDSTTDSVYLDGVRRTFFPSSEDFNLEVASFTYPNEFTEYTGFKNYNDNQPRKTFGFSYRTGDDKTGQIHIVYNAVAEPSEKSWRTVTDQTEPFLFVWDLSTRPVKFATIQPTAHVVIELSMVYPQALTALTNILYGTASVNSRLPTLAEILTTFENNAYLKVTDNGDGTWTATWNGPGADQAISMLDATTFQISWPSAVSIDAVSYTLSTY